MAGGAGLRKREGKERKSSPSNTTSSPHRPSNGHEQPPPSTANNASSTSSLLSIFAPASKSRSFYYQPSDSSLVTPLTQWWQSRLGHAVFLMSFALYAMTAYPSVTGGDAGELIITACNFGVAHPPGYPTFTLIAGATIRVVQSLASMIGVVVPAARCVNLLSCLFGALACTITYHTTVLMTDNPWTGVMASLGFGFSPTVWLYSIQGEVFALNNLLCALMAYLTIKYFESESRFLAFKPADASIDTSGRARSYLASRVLLLAYGGCLVCGLAMTNQHTTVFYVIPTVLIVLYSLHTARLLNVNTSLHLGLIMVLGMSPYVYVVVRAYAQVQDSWGDQRSLQGFLTHFLRKEYGTFQLAASETSGDPGMLARLLVYFRSTQEESLYVMPLLAVWGLIGLLNDSRRSIKLTTMVQLYSYILYVAVFHKLANLDMRPLFLGVQARFWQQANLYIYIWAAYGLHWLVTLCFRYAERTHTIATTTSDSDRVRFLRRCSALLVMTVSVGYAASQVCCHYRRMDHSASNSFYLNGHKILRSFPRDSLVLLNGDLNNNIIKYPQQCEGVRPDVRLVSLQLMTWEWFVPMQAHHYPNVTFPGTRYHVNFAHSFHLKKFLDKNVRKFPIFLCGPFKEGDYSLVKSREPNSKYYDEWPYGECVQLLPANKPPTNLTQLLTEGLSGLIRLPELPAFDPVRDTADTWEHVLYTDALQRMVYLTSFVSFHANQRMSDPSLIELAYQLTVEMVETPIIYSALVDRNLLSPQDYRACGVIYGQYSAILKGRGLAEESAASAVKMRKMWRLYLDRAPEDTEIKRLIETEINPYTGEKIVGGGHWP